ncbi:teichoic acid transporter [Sphingomonas sp. IC-11]|uniref:lipopolysaccharide biosynthesis protein n=1 Tax=Sphingomonas sp. IC-11 TaxID=2898528 RepID=UPI001E62D961|nr:teichoic acid transporter [Sphingomonas sp. IC-11]MCD2316819.1 teichoic acid transporter [Sphingomonas sp. IC-11]
MATGRELMGRSLDRATTLRLGRTVSAQAYGQIVTVVVQIALVPLLLHAWGPGTYGAWLLLSAVPFYLTFSDFGFTYVAKNAMVMAVSAGQPDAATRVFHSIFALLCVAAPLLLGLSALIIIAVDVPDVLGADAVTPTTARATVLLLVVNVLLYQFFLLVCAGIRSENRPASEAIWAASARLLEGVAVAIAAVAGGGLVAAAAAMVGARLLALLGAYRWLRRLSGWLRLGVRAADRETLEGLWRPAIAYMLLPLGQALLIQAPVLVVGGALGAVGTVTFATSRTITRMGMAAINMINNSVTAEYAALAGSGDHQRAGRLLRVQAGVTLCIILVYAVTVLVAAPVVLPLLTHGAVAAAYPFLLLLVGSVAAEMIWSSLFTPIAAVNRHGTATVIFLIVAAATVALAGPLTERFGLNGTAAALLLAHAAMIPVTLLAGNYRAR